MVGAYLLCLVKVCLPYVVETIKDLDRTLDDSTCFECKCVIY